MSTTMNRAAGRETDPIDLLVPAPRPWWVRMVIGVAIAAVVGTVAFLWGFGYIVPRPECCGSGSASAIMSLSSDGQAVTLTAAFHNSSGSDLTIRSATADLPGAEVLDVALLDPDSNVYPINDVEPFPAPAPAQETSRLLITFVPTTCADSGQAWGSVGVNLAVADSPLPSFGRTYQLPDAVFSGGLNELSVFAPAFLDGTTLPQTPLAAACALLGW
jgi:hypothetical protein